MRTWFATYWPWLIALAWLVAYELYALWTQLERKRGRRDRATPTLSQLVWRAQRQWPSLKWVVIGIVALLLSHFFFGWP